MMLSQIQNHLTIFVLDMVTPVRPEYMAHIVGSDYSFAHRWANTGYVHATYFHCQGAVSIRKTVLPGMAIPMLKIRRPNGRLIFNMEIAIRR